jgi:hypothetical protein
MPVMLGQGNLASGLAEPRQAVLLAATGRTEVSDALHWIAEGRPLTAVATTDLLRALVEAADVGLPGADRALRAAARAALNSSLDTSADLVLTDTIETPDRYDQALEAVAVRTTTGTLAGITAQAVGAAQSHDPLVIEALGLVAGLSWRDLSDRGRAQGVAFPGRAEGPWEASQIRTAFKIIDEIVTGMVRPQSLGAVASRPVELLLSQAFSWVDVERLRTDGVSYGTLLAQRDVGSAWSAHRNRTNTETSRLMIMRVLDALEEAGVDFWSTQGRDPVPPAFLATQAGARGKTPGQLAVVTRRTGGGAAYAVLVATARDGGTARKTGATLLKLPQAFELPALVVLLGTGWAARGESDDLVRAFGGQVYTEHTLADLADTAANPPGNMTRPDHGQEPL